MECVKETITAACSSRTEPVAAQISNKMGLEIAMQQAQLAVHMQETS